MVGFFCQSSVCDRYHKEQDPCQPDRAGSAALAHYLQCAICRFFLLFELDSKHKRRTDNPTLTVTDQTCYFVRWNVTLYRVFSPVVRAIIMFKRYMDFCISACHSTEQGASKLAVIAVICLTKLYRHQQAIVARDRKAVTTNNRDLAIVFHNWSISGDRMAVNGYACNRSQTVFLHIPCQPDRTGSAPLARILQGQTSTILWDTSRDPPLTGTLACDTVGDQPTFGMWPASQGALGNTQCVSVLYMLVWLWYRCTVYTGDVLYLSILCTL